MLSRVWAAADGVVSLLLAKTLPLSFKSRKATDSTHFYVHRGLPTFLAPEFSLQGSSRAFQVIPTRFVSECRD